MILKTAIHSPTSLGPIDPKNLCTVFVSPRQRAHKTFHLLFGHVETPNHILTEEAREWDYGLFHHPSSMKLPAYSPVAGEYEGLLSSEIKEKRPNWNIWLDGYVCSFGVLSTVILITQSTIGYRCPGGESVEQMENRVDRIIDSVRAFRITILPLPIRCCR